MTFKRLILLVLTVLALAKLGFSLLGSLSQPQVQSRLELYQTDLLLHAAQLHEQDSSQESAHELAAISQALVGEKPYETAQKQYEKARQEIQTQRDKLLTQLEKLAVKGENEPIITSITPAQAESRPQQLVVEQIKKIENDLAQLDLRFGILLAQQEKTSTAQQTWQELQANSQSGELPKAAGITAKLLSSLWSESPTSAPNAEAQILNNDYLDSWFRYRALSQLYETQQNQQQLLALQAQEQQTAQRALTKLILMGAIPLVGGLLGVGLLIFCGVQWFLQKEQSLLATNAGVGWKTPWDWEIIWQVLILGFFFVSQILLPDLLFPLLFGILGLDPTTMGIRTQAVYVLLSYLLMAGAGLLVLYISLKPFMPLAKDWFRIQGGKWWLWGLGGYCVALPLVVLVSLLNQQIWQGQGGSNPIILLALQAQDTTALIIFFFTASVAAPVFEELIFRGFLLPSLTRYFPVWGAILLSSLVFAIAHLSLSEVLPLTVLGIMMGFVYTRSRNILASMLLHSLWNGGTLLSLYTLGSGVN